MENNLSWTDRIVTPKTKAYKDFVKEYESTQTSKVTKEEQMSDQDKKFLEIYNYRKGSVPETKDKDTTAGIYELLTYDNDNFITNNEKFVSTAKTVAALEKLDFSDNNRYILVDNNLGLFDRELSTPSDTELLISDFYAQELKTRTDLSSGLNLNQIDEKQAAHYRNYEREFSKIGVDIPVKNTYLSHEEIYAIVPEERRGEDFHIKVSKREAEQLIALNIYPEIMNKEYGDDDHWIGMTKDDFIEGSTSFDDEYQTFEINAYPVTENELTTLLTDIKRIEFQQQEELYQEIDLFKNYEFIPENLLEVYDKWMEVESSKGFDYQDCEAFLNECESIGYTFEYQLDAQPLYLRPINLEDQLRLKEQLYEGVVGTIKWHYSGEVMKYHSKEKYLDALQNELDSNPTNFEYKTLLLELEFLKSVDDLVYGVHGEENPNSLDFYVAKIQQQEPLSERYDEVIDQNANPLTSYGKDNQFIDDMFDDIDQGTGDLWKNNNQVKNNINNQNPKSMEQNLDKQEKNSPELEIGRYANIKNSDGKIEFKGTIEAINEVDVTIRNSKNETLTAPKEQVYQYFYGQKYDLSEVKDMLENKKLPAGIEVKDLSSKDLTQMMKGEQTDTLFKGVKNEEGKEPIEYEFKLIPRYDKDQGKVTPQPEWKSKDFNLSESKIFGQDLSPADRDKLASGEKLVLTTPKDGKDINFKISYDEKLNNVIGLGFVNQKAEVKKETTNEDLTKKKTNSQKI